MNNEIKERLIAGVLLGSLLLSGCGKKSDCEIPSRHVHKYTKSITSNITLEEYIESEKLKYHGFDWNSDYIEINSHDAILYELINRYMLFDGVNNWDYLFNKMANNHDYLMFYYEYDTTETYTTTDEDGNVEVHTRTVHHDGWHRNPESSDNTGRVRLYHHRYYGYRLVYNNGEYKLDISPYVDDIRDIIEEYPYYSEDCTYEVYESFKFNKSELKYLSPLDFDVFNHPDLSQKQLMLK